MWIFSYFCLIKMVKIINKVGSNWFLIYISAIIHLAEIKTG